MKTILYYLVSSLLFSMIAVPFVLVFRFRYYRKGADVKRELAILLFFMCAVMIFCQTAVPPQFLNGDFSLSAFHAPDFSFYKLFPTLQIGWLKWKLHIKDYVEIAVNIVGNLIVFIPIGFLSPCIWKKLKARSILVGFLLSCSVEFIQLFTDRSSDYNDIILNTIGTAIGFAIYYILNKISDRWRHERKNKKNT